MQQRLDTTLLVLALAVLHRLLPVTGLLLNVEVQTGGTTDGLQTLWIRERARESRAGG